LKGANSLILPSIMSAGLGESIRFAIANRKNFNNEGKRTLDQVLPAPVIAHYEQLPSPFQTINIKTSTLKPIFAGLTLIGQTPEAGHWTDPDDDIIALAKKAKVKIRYASVTSALPVAKAIMTMTEAQQSQCFDDNVTSIDHNIKTVGPVANAWAEGRTSEFLRGTKATAANACIYSIGEVKNLREQANQAEIKTIKEALSRPGKTLMITSVRPLVAENGILTRLKAEGLTVRTPAD
jgi:TraB/PrgY/gumN family